MNYDARQLPPFLSFRRMWNSFTLQKYEMFIQRLPVTHPRWPDIMQAIAQYFTLLRGIYESIDPIGDVAS